MLDPKCIYPKCISAKCTRLACLLSFVSLFFVILTTRGGESYDNIELDEISCFDMVNLVIDHIVSIAFGMGIAHSMSIAHGMSIAHSMSVYDKFLGL